MGDIVNLTDEQDHEKDWGVWTGSRYIRKINFVFHDSETKRD